MPALIILTDAALQVQTVKLLMGTANAVQTAISLGTAARMSAALKVIKLMQLYLYCTPQDAHETNDSYLL